MDNEKETGAEPLNDNPAENQETLTPETTDTPRKEETGDPGDIEKNKAMGILAYIIFFIPIIAAKESRFAMYHANQGLILFILGLVIGVGSSIVVSVLSFIPFVGAIIGTLLFAVVFPLAYIGIVVLAILGIVNAANGKMLPLPLIGQFELLKTDL